MFWLASDTQPVLEISMMGPTDNSGSDFRAHHRGFTMLEILVVIAIVAALTTVAIFYVQQYITYAHTNADQQTLTVLNDALTRYKTQGGGTGGLTYGCQIDGVISRMQHAITWGGMGHLVMQSGVTYLGRSIAATGMGAQYHFTRFNTYKNADYASGDEAGNGSGAGTGGSGGSHGVQAYTTNGTYSWTVPTGITSVEVLTVGGGGGGGGDWSQQNSNGGGGGGGAGGLIHSTYTVTSGAIISITVGAGGTGGAVPTGGGNSKFGTYARAYGGGAGAYALNDGSGDTAGAGWGGSGGGGDSSGGAGGYLAQGNNGGSGIQDPWGYTFYGGGGGSDNGGGSGGDGVGGDCTQPFGGTTVQIGNGGAGAHITFAATNGYTGAYDGYYAGGGRGGVDTYSNTDWGGEDGTTGNGTIGHGGDGSAISTGLGVAGNDGCVIIKY
ncbi:MAG: type II secretion system protein [Terracidiphilus sp.]|jgi:prepilin-type N-terminal cleavage/methylation domain-containing protein